MWIEADGSSVPLLAAGALVGAATAVAILRTPRTRFALLAFNVAVGAVAGAIAVVGIWWPHAPIMVAVGFVSAAAPITLAIPLTPRIESMEAGRAHIRRSLLPVAVHIVYSTAAGLAGFACAYGLAVSVLGDVT